MVGSARPGSLDGGLDRTGDAFSLSMLWWAMLDRPDLVGEAGALPDEAALEGKPLRCEAERTRDMVE